MSARKGLFKKIIYFPMNYVNLLNYNLTSEIKW